MQIPSELKSVWRVVQVVMTNLGVGLGLYLYTWAAYFHDLFAERGAAEETNMLLVAILFLVHLGLVALLEVPMGALGDAIGRKSTVIWSLFARIIFFGGMAAMHYCGSLSFSYMFGVIASIAFAINYTMFSGTFTAWVVDATLHKAPDFAYESMIGRSHIYRLGSLVFGSLLGMYVYLHGLAHIAYLSAAFMSVGTLIYCAGTMDELKHMDVLSGSARTISTVFSRMGRIVSLSFKVCRESRAVVGLIGVYAAYMFMLNIVEYYWPVAAKSYLQLSEHSIRWSFITAAVTSLSAISAFVFTKYTDRRQLRNSTAASVNSMGRWLVVSALCAVFVVGSFSLLSSGQNLMIFYFMFAVCSVEAVNGIFAPAYESLLNRNIPREYAEERATIMSFGSMIRSCFVLLLTIPASGSSGKTTVAAWIVPAVVLFVATIYVAYTLRSTKSDLTSKQHEASNA